MKPTSNGQIKDTARVWIEALAGLFPGVSSIISLGKHYYPMNKELNNEEWQQQVTEFINFHAQSLHSLFEDEEIIISESAGAVIIYCLKQCTDGLGDVLYEREDLISYFDFTEEQLMEFIYELEQRELIQIRNMINHCSIRLTHLAYMSFDWLALGFDTNEDAKLIAETMLDINSGSVTEVSATLNWSKRRLNPPLQMILHRVPERAIRNLIQPDYAAYGIILTDEVKCILKDIASDEF
ncbi:MAG: hypothetical protein CMP47_02895 [Rickettsiales bacterium]|nr:hypothetical protein [Rickettsiales bacterium]